MSGYIETFESVDDEYLEHFGIRGMHWGLRRYQNKDGSSTSAGKKRREDPKRVKMIAQYKSNQEFTKKSLEKNKKDLEDLQKNGYNSRIFKIIKKSNDVDSDKDILKDAINEQKKEIRLNNDYIKTNKKVLENISPYKEKNKDFYDYHSSMLKGLNFAGSFGTIAGVAIGASSSKSIGKKIIRGALGGFLGAQVGVLGYLSSGKYKADEAILNQIEENRNKVN